MAVAEPVFHPRRLGHVNLVVDDVDTATRFYKDVCGLTLAFSEKATKASFMGTGNTHHDIALMGRVRESVTIAEKSGLHHMAWEMDTEQVLVQSLERAMQRGVNIFRLADHQISHSAYLRDPDGNVVEFYADTIKDWSAVLHGELDLITQPWNPASSPAKAERLWEQSPVVRAVEGAAFQPARFSHAVLTTRDIEAMRAFYVDVAGLDLVGGHDELALLKGSESESAFDLALVLADRDGLHHFSFEMDSEPALARCIDRLGMVQGVHAERVIENAVKRSVFLRDPDGFLVEFFVRSARAGTIPASADSQARAFCV